MPARSPSQPHGSPRLLDGGSASLTTVLLIPIFVLLAFVAFQAALFSHARTEARVIARDAAGLVGRGGVSAHVAQVWAEEVLRSESDLGSPSVSITDEGGFVTVTITGRAPGIVRGTSVDIRLSEALPIEGFRP